MFSSRNGSFKEKIFVLHTVYRQSDAHEEYSSILPALVDHSEGQVSWDIRKKRVEERENLHYLP